MASVVPVLQPGNYLDMTTALGLTPDSFSFKLYKNFCCLIAKNFIMDMQIKRMLSKSQQFLALSEIYIPIRK